MINRSVSMLFDYSNVTVVHKLSIQFEYTYVWYYKLSIRITYHR